jgi:hypothetical protein
MLITTTGEVVKNAKHLHMNSKLQMIGAYDNLSATVTCRLPADTA